MSLEQYQDWKPNQASRARLATIGKVLEEYAADGIVLTLRQLHYQLVSKNIIANTHREYKNLGELLSKARLAGLVDWDSIEDRVRRAVQWRSYESIQDCVRDAAEGFTLPRWADQPNYIELWCEKDALSSVLRPICSELFATFMVNRGHSSTSAMHDARERIESQRVDRIGNVRDVKIIYLGDFDPSGEDMVRDIRDRMAMFQVEDLEVIKLALNPDQVSRWKLPPNPVKASDSRTGRFKAKHGSKCYEVDAIPPKDLQKLVRRSIQDEMNMDLYEDTLQEEARLRAKLVKAVAGIK